MTVYAMVSGGELSAYGFFLRSVLVLAEKGVSWAVGWVNLRK
jgi:hypothetical protein